MKSELIMPHITAVIKPALRPIFDSSLTTGIMKQAMPTIMKATGKVARVSFGANLIPINPPTKTIIEPIAPINDWAAVRSQTLGCNLGKNENKAELLLKN